MTTEWAVDVTYETWKEVPAAQKDSIWKDIQAEFDIPEASNGRTKKKVLQTVNERWRQFKYDLTRKWTLAADKDSVDDTVKNTALVRRNGLSFHYYKKSQKTATSRPTFEVQNLNPSCLSLFLLHLQPWQGKPQLVSNINACTAVADVVRTTLDPRGMDKLIHDDKGTVTISNDGATIMKLLDIVHPAAKILADIAKSQDSEVGDGTTNVVLLAAEFLREAKPFIEDGVHSQNFIKLIFYIIN
ncbi:uncharacterized protein [Glycine max]|uniref:uncharacterized protein n=1 Tax=Glycine max TaxID=3847 RepID=UPI001B357138|nr:uncharacterized protein LOC102666375 [Glycine max]